jgi:hypothetical protein
LPPVWVTAIPIALLREIVKQQLEEAAALARGVGLEA